MKCNRRNMLLYAITDRAWLNGATLYNQVKEALEGGATCLQLREKDLDKETFQEEAMEIKKLCREYNIPFIINDNVELAILCGADGIHVGQSDMPVSQVRKAIGPDMILGVSAQTVSQAVKAQQEGADYLGVGAVFATSTKADASEVSKDTLREICNTVDIPVVAIGGINKENIKDLSATGVDGVALISAIFSAKEITKTCEELLLLSKEMTGYEN